MQMCRRVGAASVGEAFPARLRRGSRSRHSHPCRQVLNGPGIPITACCQEQTAPRRRRAWPVRQNYPVCSPSLTRAEQATAVQNGPACGPSHRSAALRDRWDPPARLGGKFAPGGQARGGSCGQHRESPRPATGRQAGRLGTGPAVVPGQDPAEGAGPAGDGAVADLAVRDPKRGSGHGKRREPGLPARSRDAGPVAVTVPCAARTPPGPQEGCWPAGRVNTA